MSNSAIVALTTSMYGRPMGASELQSRIKHPTRLSEKARAGYLKFRQMVLHGHIKIDQLTEDIMNEIDTALERQ